jgi:hypothetical protein
VTADPTASQQDNWLMTRRYGWEPLVALLVMDVLFGVPAARAISIIT